MLERIAPSESPALLLHFILQFLSELVLVDEYVHYPNQEIIEIRLNSNGGKSLYSRGSPLETSEFPEAKFSELVKIYQAFIGRDIQQTRSIEVSVPFETNPDFGFWITSIYRGEETSPSIEFSFRSGDKSGHSTNAYTHTDEDAEQISSILLETLIAVCGEYLSQEKVTEVSCNRPEELWIGYQGQHEMVRVARPELTLSVLSSFATLVAESTGQHVTLNQPLLTAQIPTGIAGKYYRIQFVKEPAVAKGHLAFSIRKPVMLNMTWDSYREMFSRVKTHNYISEEEKAIRELFQNGEYHAFLESAVKLKKTIIVSAATDSGKSTLVNSLTGLIPLHERLITIEDAAELDPPHKNVLSLFYSRGGQGVSDVTVQNLLDACLRLRPNRILMGELRGEDAFTFLQMIYSGHPGAITTLHAESPKACLDRLAMMVLQNGTTLTTGQVKDLIEDTVDVIIQLKRTPSGGYGCESIYYKGCSSILVDNWKSRFVWQCDYLEEYIAKRANKALSHVKNLWGKQ